jgi:hypothetical protein
VLRDGGLERETRLAVRQRREQEAEDAASGRELHQRSAVFALAGDDHDQLGEMLGELSDHRRDVGRARGVGHQYARLEVGQLAGDVIEIRSGRHRRAARGGLLDGFDQVRVAAQHQDRRVMRLLGAGAMRVELQIDLVGRAMCRPSVLSVGHTNPSFRGFHVCRLILLMQHGMTENCICLFQSSGVNCGAKTGRTAGIPEIPPPA